MDPVKLAVIGAGLIGRKHAELIAGDDGCSLVGICDVDPRCRSVADEFNAPFYEHVEDLLKAERPEGVVVSTPNADHASVVELCAKNSVHVLIEKPIADSMEASIRIIDIADRMGIKVLVGHHRRHSPLIQKVSDVVQSGMLGQLIAVSMMWTLLKPPEYFDLEWRRRRPGGGPALINLIHELDILRFICGEVSEVYARSSSTARRFEVEDSLSISILLKSGVVASIIASDATPSPWSYEAASHENPHYFHTDQNCYHFFGTLGALGFPRMDLWSYSENDRSGWQHPLSKSEEPVVRSDPLQAQLKHFCRVVKGQEYPLVDGQDAARSLAIALGVLKSMDTKAPVVIETP
ncbi:Gfo/Idh/MocA family oxidoreductase [Dehalococcoidia bacterium]|nr:Gfo/Idh/MocA family oxidoreductase [Dehalococcoidia bacterium]